MKYDDIIHERVFFDDEKKIIAIITNEDPVHSSGLRFYCRFLDENRNYICEGPGYLKDDWRPIPTEEIKKIYYENVRKEK